MALTRKMLAAMEISEEKIGEIMNAHLATVNEIKDERDTLKADAAKLPAVEKELESAKEKLESYKSGDWENKYNTLKSEYDTFKTDTETKAIKASKEAAYKQLLQDAGVSDKRMATVIKAANINGVIDGLKLDKDGKVENSAEITESVKSEWADFIVTKHEEGVDTPKPPANDGDGGKQPSRAAEMVAKYRSEHYGSGNSKED